MKTRSLGALVAAATVAVASSAYAAPANFYYTGNFSGDADVVFVQFDVVAGSNVQFRTWSYAGGTMGDGTEVPAGGFDPVMEIFGPGGDRYSDYAFHSAYDDEGSAPADLATRLALDLDVTVSGLPEGTYVARVMQHDNKNNSGDLNTRTETYRFFTAKFGCSNGQFCDPGGNNRTSNLAFEVLGAKSARVVPLPAGLPLMLTGLASLGFLARRRKAA